MSKPDRPAKGKARYTPIEGTQKKNKFSAAGAAATIRARQSRNNRAYNQLGN